MIVSEDRLKVPTQALLLFISAENGSEYYTVEKLAFNKESFGTALRELRE